MIPSLPTPIPSTPGPPTDAYDQPTTYDQLLPGAADLWGSILDSVSHSREKGVLPTRRLIVLGDSRSSFLPSLPAQLFSCPTCTKPCSSLHPKLCQTGDRNSGKSTLVDCLAPSNPSAQLQSPPLAQLPMSDRAEVDIGTSYSTVDIGDDGEDDALARLSIHQIPSSRPPYSDLLPLILNAGSLRESLILILLPFSHPHSLLTSLVRWLALIDSVIQSIKETIKPGSGGERGEYVVEEARDALEAQYRAYHDPAGSSAGQPADGPEPAAGIHLDLPLPPGTLTENVGIGIVVVCTKADQIDTLEREKDFKEEQFDFIQQVLRTVLLRFGGALFFTSDKKPESLARLRSYVLHRLFGQLVSSATTGTGTGTGAANGRLFPFGHQANVVDRDEVVIPMGWDSWGKIKILRDGFEPVVFGSGWLFDLEREARRRREGGPEGPVAEEDVVGWDSEGSKVVSACKLWEEMIGEMDEDLPSINPHDRVVVTDEQEFLKAKYTTIKKERDLDPLSHFQLGSKPHSLHQAVGAKYTNGTLDKGGALGMPSSSNSSVGGLGSAGMEEEMNAQLAKLSMRVSRDWRPGSGEVGEAEPGSRPQSAAALSPVELLHFQQLQMLHSPRRVGGTPGLSRTTSAVVPGSSVGTPQAEKELLANFFGKLLVKEPAGGTRSLGGVSSSVGGVGSSSNGITPGLVGGGSKSAGAPIGRSHTVFGSSGGGVNGGESMVGNNSGSSTGGNGGGGNEVV